MVWQSDRKYQTDKILTWHLTEYQFQFDSVSINFNLIKLFICSVFSLTKFFQNKFFQNKFFQNKFSQNKFSQKNSFEIWYKLKILK